MIWTIGYHQEKNFCSEWKLQKKESVSDLQKWKFAHVNCSRKELVMNRNLYIRYESIGYRRNKQAVPLQSKQGPYYRLLVFCNKKRHTVGNWLHWRWFDTFRRVLSIWNQQCQQSAVTTWCQCTKDDIGDNWWILQEEHGSIAIYMRDWRRETRSP